MRLQPQITFNQTAYFASYSPVTNVHILLDREWQLASIQYLKSFGYSLLKIHQIEGRQGTKFQVISSNFDTTEAYYASNNGKYLRITKNFSGLSYHVQKLRYLSKRYGFYILHHTLSRKSSSEPSLLHEIPKSSKKHQ